MHEHGEALHGAMRSLVLLMLVCGVAHADEKATQQAIAKAWPDGCFAARIDGKTYESHAKRCAKPRRPFSTFKIANALIAVDVGVLDGADAAMTWDKDKVPDQKQWRDSWRKPHTLRTGIAVSAVPYFRTLALQIGEERMKKGLEKLAYGNRDLSGGLDKFWLVGGGMRISAREQLAFVDSLAQKKLAVSQKAQEVLADITTLEKKNDRVLHGKTGSGPLEHGKGGWIVWQVGWIELDGKLVPYAAWMESNAKKVDDARAARDKRLRATLAALDVFPAP